MNIRQESAEDHKYVFDLIEAAFRDMELSDHKEHFLVERLRKSDAFIPELSLVAEEDEKIIGHIILTKISIVDEDIKHTSLALAPVSVLPSHQSKGVGSALIRKAHDIANHLGYNSIILVGHPDYYPRFGYVPISSYSITLPFEVPPEASMIKILNTDDFVGIKGQVEYSKAFFE